MYKFLSRLFDRIEQGLRPRDKILVVSLLLIISTLGIVLAVRYYEYIQKNPEFCNSCHLMEEAYLAWKLSAHNTITCQICHHLGMVEQNRLLVKFVFTTNRATPEPHGLETPWQMCTQCHKEEASQGAEQVDKSTGHAKHVFMEKIECKQCHMKKVHVFLPDKDACLRCHKEWVIHGVGMQELSCFQCHAFSAITPERLLPDRARCLSCHRALGSFAASFAPGAPMATLDCYECHKPHTHLQPTIDDCLRCHPARVLSDAHGHRQAPLCTGCHKPHRWKAH